jgi:hypothetical protein
MGFTKKWIYFSLGVGKHELGLRCRACRRCGCVVAAGTDAYVALKLKCGKSEGDERKF